MTRADQPSNSALQQDVKGFQELAILFPLLFLTAAGLATAVLMRRVVTAQRPTIGMLRACGYSSRQVVGHFISFGLVVGVVRRPGRRARWTRARGAAHEGLHGGALDPRVADQHLAGDGHRRPRLRRRHRNRFGGPCGAGGVPGSAGRGHARLRFCRRGQAEPARARVAAAAPPARPLADGPPFPRPQSAAQPGDGARGRPRPHADPRLVGHDRHNPDPRRPPVRRDRAAGRPALLRPPGRRRRAALRRRRTRASPTRSRRSTPRSRWRRVASAIRPRSSG